ncbi:hypothetical protein D3C86_1969310 [compost metagenome]
MSDLLSGQLVELIRIRVAEFRKRQADGLLAFFKKLQCITEFIQSYRVAPAVNYPSFFRSAAKG